MPGKAGAANIAQAELVQRPAEQQEQTRAEEQRVEPARLAGVASPKDFLPLKMTGPGMVAGMGPLPGPIGHQQGPMQPDTGHGVGQTPLEKDAMPGIMPEHKKRPEQRPDQSDKGQLNIPDRADRHGAITGHDQEQVKAQIGQRAFGLDLKAVARDPGPQSRQGQLISRHGTPFGCARSPVTQLRTLLH